MQSDPVNSAALALANELRAATKHPELTSCIETAGLASVGLGGRGDELLVITWRQRDHGEPLLSYYLVAWQPLYGVRGDAMRIPPALLTVTEAALVYGPVSAGLDQSAQARTLADGIAATVAGVIDVAANQAEHAPEFATPLPQGLRLIAARRRAHYVELEVAIPGTSVVDDGVIQRLAPDAMIRLLLTPDVGPISERWLAPRPTL